MDILKKITEMREARGWSEYQLAEQAGIAQSTISSWYRKQMVPTIPSLEKICRAFGINLSQFFYEDRGHLVYLSDRQQLLLEYSSRLQPEQMDALLHFLQTLHPDHPEYYYLHHNDS